MARGPAWSISFRSSRWCCGWNAAGAGSAVIERAAHEIQSRIADAEQQTIAEALLVLFATRHVGADAAMALFRRLFVSTEILEQSPLYRMWIAEAQVATMRQATRTALLGRWQTLPAEVEAALATVSVEALNEVLAHLTTDTMEQLRVRLGL
jgi:hypothetical protein